MSAAAPITRILAVDFGDKRTGLAATDPTGTIASPLDALIGLDDKSCAAAIAATARERDAQVIVVGLPLAARGEIGHRAQRTLRFIDVLRGVTPCAIETVDETYTTDEAHERLRGMKAARRKKYADSVAAVIILERWQGTAP